MDTQNDFLDNAVNDELDIGQEVDMQSQMCSYLHDVRRCAAPAKRWPPTSTSRTRSSSA